MSHWLTNVVLHLLLLLLPAAIDGIGMPEALHKQGDKNKIAFKLIADIFQLIALVSIDITDAQQFLDNRESLAPV